MNTTKRAWVRIISFTTAAFLTLGVRNLQLMKQSHDANIAVKYSYSRAVSDLCSEVENVKNTLEKELYTGSGQLHQALAAKLYSEAMTAKASLSQLPLKNTSLENTSRFLSQVGDYSMSVSKKLMNGEELTDEEYKNMASLYDFSKRLSLSTASLEQAAENGSYEYSDANLSSELPAADDRFADFEDSFENYPSLIYDGPFSDNILNKQPLMTKDKAEVTKEKALYRCSSALGINSADFTKISDVTGSMPAWRFTDINLSASCEVTKNGGYISYFLHSRTVSSEKLTSEQGVKAAEKLLDDLGILSMQTTYYEKLNNVLTVNFAYKDSDKCCYTDLVKVSVALDNGQILGYDARGFLVNHHDRSYPEKLMGETAAEKKVSKRLEIKSHSLAVIPTDNKGEKLCYEFKCKAKTGRTVLVYINAQTGDEEQILILLESKNGTLTI